jgi:very-short-patch-repair endonuclease|tara:strand:- start:1240 stop:1653 length:414 start_codon:yes stop_codon:yes gene_type:complete
MIFLCTNGRKKKISNSVKYLIDWDADCRSGIQKTVKNVLHDNWFADVVFEEFPVAGTRLTFDFFNATRNIAIEVDGNQHYKYNKFFHSNSRQNFLSQLKRDEKKEYFCEINNISLLRILESEILKGEFPDNFFLKNI